MFALWAKSNNIFVLYIDMDGSMEYEIRRLKGVSDGAFYAYSGFVIHDSTRFYFAGSTRKPENYVSSHPFDIGFIHSPYGGTCG